MSNGCVKIRKKTPVDCLTCPLCFNLFTEATTICLCFHTFCRACIYQKLEGDRKNCCPVCNVYLGSCPEEKLRPDNNLQAIRIKVFPVKKSSAFENKSRTPMLTKRKERSLSSISATSTVIRGNKPATRAALQKSIMSKEVNIKFCTKKDVKGVIKNPGSSSSHEGSKKLSKVSKQRTSGNKTALEPQTHPECSFNMQDKCPEWEGLNVLAETANRAEKSNIDLLVSAIDLNKEENPPTNNTGRLKRSSWGLKSGKSNRNVNDEYHSVHSEKTSPISDVAVRINDSKMPYGEASIANRSPDNTLRRLYPVWFVLLACRDKKRVPYPQIPKRYIRIKDRNVPVSCINKYLMQKLNLRHESEVEVMCCGQAAPPNAMLNELVDIWVRSESSIDGSSSDVHDFVMVLTYRRR
ncbi:E3 ubiquitin protein ligase drip2 [Thalictrum thalictroides]|uniref:E3 ubiquitin protein ligase drip2 n=1 Tax=Thalictrum thalictroides TaxID=46969 RepID=A0A7J6X1V2_THATH|nr:E3 ubiquitin protein ligase drip2 [Thalictrum thalictroides]